jgi:hypothetical protein
LDANPNPVTETFNGDRPLLFRYVTETGGNKRWLVMTNDQKAVVAGASSGIIGMILLVWGLSSAITPPIIADTAADRIAYTFPWLVPPALLLFAMIAAVGNARFASEAIDPTLGKESQRMMVDGRVTDNTTQQFILFLVGLLALSVSMPIGRMSIIPALSIAFVLLRVAFWVGYRIKPVYRAFGFASTAYMNLGMLLASLWLWLR